MVPRLLFLELDGVGELPHAGSFGRGCRPGVLGRQPRPVDFCDAALSQLFRFLYRVSEIAGLSLRRRGVEHGVNRYSEEGSPSYSCCPRYRSYSSRLILMS